MTSSPFFSIAIPTYNRAEKLNNAINKILKQSFKDFEIVISDNCSSDDTRKVVLDFKDKRIKYFKTREHTDVMPNVRKSINLSKGKYVFLHGDDDYLLNDKVLEKLHKIISRTKAGYIRVNYLSLSPDEKYVFDFRASKNFIKDKELKPQEKNIKIINFILDSDPSFLSGIVFRNSFPKTVTIINSELYSWFPILFYCASKFGAYYVNAPSVIAGWSQWRVKADNFNSLYSLRAGKLTSEEYFSFIKKQLDPQDFNKLLRKHLLGIYVKRFAAIKLFTGNDNMLKLSKRLKELDPGLYRMPYYWISFIPAYIFPRFLLGIIKKLYLFAYIRYFMRKTSQI